MGHSCSDAVSQSVRLEYKDSGAFPQSRCESMLMCWRAGEYERELFPLPSLLLFWRFFSLPPLSAIRSLFSSSICRLFPFARFSFSFSWHRPRLLSLPFPYCLPSIHLQSANFLLALDCPCILAFLHSCIPAYTHIDHRQLYWQTYQFMTSHSMNSRIRHSECVHFNLSISINSHSIFSSFLMREIKTENSYARHWLYRFRRRNKIEEKTGNGLINSIGLTPRQNGRVRKRPRENERFIKLDKGNSARVLDMTEMQRSEHKMWGWIGET